MEKFILYFKPERAVPCISSSLEMVNFTCETVLCARDKSGKSSYLTGQQLAAAGESLPQ